MPEPPATPADASSRESLDFSTPVPPNEDLNFSLLSPSAAPVAEPDAAAEQPEAASSIAAENLLAPPPELPEIPEMPLPPKAPLSNPILPSKPPKDPTVVAVETDERFVSLRRSYGERLVSMAAVFRDLPRRLTEDGPLSALRMCDEPADQLRERAFEIFQEALESSQEEQLSSLQQQLSAQETETARLGRQLGTLLFEQRECTDVNGVRLQAAEKELGTARIRLGELEEFYRKASTRQAALQERAETMEEETLYWRKRGAPLRERCEALEAENVALRTERDGMHETVETAKRVQRESEAEVVTCRAEVEGAKRIAVEAREQALQATKDAEGRWLHQGLSIVLSKVFEVVPMEEAVQQGMYSAATGEEFTNAGAAFVESITARFRGLESALAESNASLTEAKETLAAGEEELIKGIHPLAHKPTDQPRGASHTLPAVAALLVAPRARRSDSSSVRVPTLKARTTASMAAQHAHEMVERTIAAQTERWEMDLLKATKEEREAREAAEAERDALREAARTADDELKAAKAKAKVRTLLSSASPPLLLLLCLSSSPPFISSPDLLLTPTPLDP